MADIDRSTSAPPDASVHSIRITADSSHHGGSHFNSDDIHIDGRDRHDPLELGVFARPDDEMQKAVCADESLCCVLVSQQGPSLL